MYEFSGRYNDLLERLENYCLLYAIDKCYFGKQRLDFLGHVVPADHNGTKQEHIRGVVETRPPRSRKELQEFLGLCGWISEYVLNFYQVAAPVTALISTKKPYKWTPEADTAFEAIKELFRRPLRVHRLLPDRRFYLQTDAADAGIGSVVYQLGDNGEKRIISHTFAKFSERERGYHSNERQCLAVVWAIRKYKHLLEDVNFMLRTHKEALKWLHKVCNEKGKLLR